MKRALICGGSFLSLIVAAAALSTSSADAAAAKSAKEIMGALFKGPKAAMGTLKTAAKAETPDWAKIQKASETFVTCTSELPKAEAPLGDQASFEKLSKALAVNAKALDKAADAKDLDGVKSAMQKIGSSCMACHKAHKPK